MKSVKLLLTDNVPSLGIVGDVVTVKPGYARNYLIPHGLGSEPTEGNIARLAERRAVVEAEMKAIRSAQQKMIEGLEGYELTLERSCNEQGVLFGGVSQHDIAEALREKGLAIEDRFVRIGQQIKRLDSYDIPVVIDSELKAEIKLWVVSDRPMQNDDDDADDNIEVEAEVDAEVADEEAAKAE